jgi:hypothetical protein
MNVWTPLTCSVVSVLSLAGIAQAGTLSLSTSPLVSQGLGTETRSSPGSTQYQTYRNDTYNFTVEIPQTLYGSAAPMVGKMGQRFLSPAGDVEVAVYGQSQGNWTLEQLYENTLFVYRQQGAEITFSELTNDEFTISAIDPEGAVLYTKKIFHQDNLLTLGLFYDADRQDTLEPVVDYIAASFQPME